MRNIYRIIVVLTLLVTGLAGSLTVFGISLHITYTNNLEGEVWGFMCYTGLIYYLILFAVIYIVGFVFAIIYTEKQDR